MHTKLEAKRIKIDNEIIKKIMRASKAVGEIRRWNDEHLPFEAVGEPVDMKQALTPETRQQCEALGRAMAERLLE